MRRAYILVEFRGGVRLAIHAREVACENNVFAFDVGTVETSKSFIEVVGVFGLGGVVIGQSSYSTRNDAGAVNVGELSDPAVIAVNMCDPVTCYTLPGPPGGRSFGSGPLGEAE